MSIYKKPRRGGANGSWCLGNNEPDGLPYLATWNGRSEGCASKAEADDRVRQMRRDEFDAEVKRRGGR